MPTELRRLALGAVLACTLCSGRLAHADENTAAAANAYSRAQKAALAGDYEKAAELFELADGLAPTPQALRGAASAHKAGGKLGAAARSAEELRARYPDDAESQKLAGEILDEAKQKLARYEVSCTPDPCQLLVDDGVATASPKSKQVIYLEPGSHELGAVFGSRSAKPKRVTASAGASTSLAFNAPPAAAEPKATRAPAAGAAPSDHGDVEHDRGGSESRGLSPWFFGVAAGATVVLGGVTTWSALDVLSARDEYDKHRTEAGYQDGLSRQRRTNALIGATGVAAAATLTLALFTDFGGHSAKSAKRARTPAPPLLSAGVGPHSASLSVVGSF